MNYFILCCAIYLLGYIIGFWYRENTKGEYKYIYPVYFVAIIILAILSIII
jgi:hypothetical protein